MQITIKHLLAVLVGVALAFLMPMDVEISKKRNPKRGKAGAATVRVGGNWAKIRYLREHLQNAIQIAPVAAGGGFMEEPNVRVGNREEVAGILRTDFDAAFRAMGAKDDATVAGMALAFAERLPAIYDPAENMIHVIPENAVEAAARAGDESLLEDGVLKLLLVRMAVIALDRQLYPEWKEALDAAKDRDALNAAMAILQGHAQYATERVVTAAHAQEWKNLKPDFDKLVAFLITEGPSHPLKDGMDADIKFAILKGHAFMKLLAKKKGQGGIQRNFKEPPATPASIEDPEATLGASKSSSRKKGKLPERVAEEFAGLHGEGWTTETGEMAQAEVDAMLEGIEPQYTASIRAAFAAGSRWTFANADTGRTMTLRLIEMKHAGQAEALVNSAMGAAKKTDATVEEGAGRDNGLAGFTIQRNLEDGVKEFAQWTYEGKYVLGFATTDPDMEREPQDDALEAAAEVISKSQKTRESRRKRR